VIGATSVVGRIFLQPENWRRQFGTFSTISAQGVPQSNAAGCPQLAEADVRPLDANSRYDRRRLFRALQIFVLMA
jgi:hypothetical protein